MKFFTQRRGGARKFAGSIVASLREISLQDRCLGADIEEMPTLKSVDRLRRDANVCSLEIECFGSAPVEADDRVKRCGRRW